MPRARNAASFSRNLATTIPMLHSEEAITEAAKVTVGPNRLPISASRSRALRHTLSASAAGTANRQHETNEPARPRAAKRKRADEADRAKDGSREKLVIDEQADQLLDDCADHASAAAVGFENRDQA